MNRLDQFNALTDKLGYPCAHIAKIVNRCESAVKRYMMAADNKYHITPPQTVIDDLYAALADRNKRQAGLL